MTASFPGWLLFPQEFLFVENVFCVCAVINSNYGLNADVVAGIAALKRR